jgi:hypothetical protein
MKIVVFGGLGLIGPKNVAILRRGGHNVFGASPNTSTLRPGPPNNSMELPPLRFAKHPEGRGSSTDPGQPSVWLWRDTTFGWPGGSSRGR